MSAPRCDTCRWWERDTHAVGECGRGYGVQKADSSCQLWQSFEAKPLSMTPHVIVPDTEGGTRVSLTLWPALVEFVQSIRGWRNR